MPLNTVIRKLDEAASRYPNKIAITDEVREVTFKQYQYESKVLATNLIRIIGCHNIPIAVYMPKNIECLEILMAVLYSGNFYCPIPFKSPRLRAASIMESLDSPYVITSYKFHEEVTEFYHNSEYILYFEDLCTGEIDNRGIEQRLLCIIDTDPVYILFTSGSTGDPKGVVLPHRAIHDYMQWSVNKFNLNEENNLASQAPFHFDASMPDIYTPLYSGATLNLFSETLFMFPIRLVEFLNRKKVNTLIWVPSALMTLTNKNIFEKNVLIYLKLVMFCGEVMPNRHLNIWRKYHPNAAFVNLYGPTEAAYACTYFIIDRCFSDNQSLPIGIACENTEIFLLNEEKQRVSQAGEIGEICIRGSCLASGYYKKIVNDSFIQNPLNNNYMDRIYKTGDLGSLNELGEFMYIGRCDSQIKHMGYRIELGEIETAVSALSYVKNCCVLFDWEKDSIVLIYEAVESFSQQNIRIDLREKIPRYMMPGRFIRVDIMPYNLNGKIDREWLKKEYVQNAEV